jgi:hypothetical protein
LLPRACAGLAGRSIRPVREDDVATNVWLVGVVDKIIHNRRTTKFRLVADESVFRGEGQQNYVYVELPPGMAVQRGDRVRVEGELVSHRFSRSLVDEIGKLLARHYLQRLMPGIERLLGESGYRARVEHTTPEVLASRIQRVEP